LVEILCAITIIAILAAILFPVLAGGKSRAKGAVEISNLHQLALAGAQYHDEYGQWPMTLTTVFKARLAPSPVMVSPLDTTKNGLGNDLADFIDSQCKSCRVEHSSYRRTFVGPDDFGNSDALFTSKIEPQPDAGWLVSLAQSSTDHPSIPGSRFNSPTGPYLRLTIAGSVERKTHSTYQSSNGPVFAMPFLFADGDEKWRQSIVGF